LGKLNNGREQTLNSQHKRFTDVSRETLLGAGCIFSIFQLEGFFSMQNNLRGVAKSLKFVAHIKKRALPRLIPLPISDVHMRMCSYVTSLHNSQVDIITPPIR